MWERRGWGAILASRGRALRAAAQVRNYAPSSIEEWSDPLCHVRGKCRASVFYMCLHVLRRGGGALGPDSLCWPVAMPAHARGET